MPWRQEPLPVSSVHSYPTSCGGGGMSYWVYYRDWKKIAALVRILPGVLLLKFLIIMFHGTKNKQTKTSIFISGMELVSLHCNRNFTLASSSGLPWYPLRWRHNGCDGISNTRLTIIYSTVYSDTDQRKHQSSASLAFVRVIHRGPVNSPHKWPVTRKMFPFHDVIMLTLDINSVIPVP